MKSIQYLILIISISSILPSYGQEKKDEETILTPVMDVKIDGHKNLIYCATFQLAWDELKKIADGKIEMENPPACLKSLNDSPISKKVVPKDAYIATAGFVEDGIIKKIDKKLKKKFGKSFEDMSYQPNDEAIIIAFSYLYRKLTFKRKFNRFKKKGLTFYHGASKTKVTCFGCKPKSADGYTDYIKIRDYKNKDNFILQLLMKRKNETIVLSKIPTPKTLQKGIDLTADTLLKKWKPYEKIIVNGERSFKFNELSSHDTFLMPILKLNKQANFDKLCGKKLENPIFEDRSLGQAFQKVKFKLDESGAVLESEAGMDDWSDSGEPRKFIFNKPFLLCLWKTGAKLPYLAIWVNNPDILQKFKIPKKK